MKIGDLLPCPFCGGKADIMPTCFFKRKRYVFGYKVKCTSCGVAISEYDFKSSLEQAEDIVISKWNNRASGEPCHFCFSAAFDSELDEMHDYSSCVIGKMPHDYRLMFSSGCGLPPRIEFDEYDYNIKEWRLRLGRYFPKFCPECGRKITEYQDKIK